MMLKECLEIGIIFIEYIILFNKMRNYFLHIFWFYSKIINYQLLSKDIHDFFYIDD